jgi:hypothetical protein
MAVNTIAFQSNMSANANRGPSDVIWSNCPWNSLVENPELGMTFFDDFNSSGLTNVDATGGAVRGSSMGWGFYMAQASTGSDQALEGGVLGIGSTTQNRGVTLIGMTGGFRIITTSTLAYNRALWFEARFARSSVATTDGDYFVGLCIPALSSSLVRANYPITTTIDTLDSTNGTFLGFHSNQSTGTRGGPTEIAFTFNLAGGTINYPTGLTTCLGSANIAQTVLAANTFVKVGFMFDPNAINAIVSSATARQTLGNTRRKVIRIFVNGVEEPTFLSSDDVQNATAGQAFPTGFMAPCVAVMPGAGAGARMQIDWIRVAQLGNS